MVDVDFDSLVQKYIPTLQALEKKRKELLKQGRSQGLKYAAIMLAVGVVALIIVNIVWVPESNPNTSFNVFALIALVVISVIIVVACINSKSGILTSFYKKEVVNEIIQAFCPNAIYSPDRGIGANVFIDCGLFISPDRYHAEDLIEGRLDKTTFMCSEIHAEERKTRHTKNGVRHYWVDIFRGFFFRADFHKEFQGETTVVRNRIFKIRIGESRVKMENPDFEKVFDVFSTNPVEARYLITPSMMERMLKLNYSFTKGIAISFRNSMILVAIPHSANRFEATIWNSLNNTYILKSDISVLQSLLAIVDELNLNTRIWSKE